MLLKNSDLILAIASAVKNSDLDCHAILTIEIGSHQLISHVNVTGTLTQLHFHELSFKNDEPLSA